MRIMHITNQVLFVGFISLLFTTASAQGIQFTKGLNWDQVKQKAKEENKYLFVDCFTTWCGPCKRMDNEVYINDTVGKFMNSKFVSVKVQMDQTTKDDPYVRSWYSDAKLIEKKYHISAYPTLLFLSPKGEIIQKNIGYMPPVQLLAVAGDALTPGKRYNDPFAKYKQLLAEYRSGKRDYAMLPYMVEQAGKAGDWDVRNMLYLDYKSHLLSLPKDSLYTKRNLIFISKTIKTSNNAFFEVLFPNGKRSDRVMNNPYFSSSILDKIIEQEITDSVIGRTYGHAGGPDDDIFKKDVTPTIAEPDWQHLYKLIKSKYDKPTAKRNLLNAKCKWYLSNFDQYGKQWMSSCIEKLNTYGYDTTDIIGAEIALNGIGWRVFLNSNDQFQLSSIAHWINDLLKHSQDYNAIIDTYANLLYKLGRNKEAIHWEQKALDNAVLINDEGSIRSFKNIIKAMKSGVPTWINYNILVAQPI